MRAQCLQTIEKAPFGGALKTERGGVYVALGFSGAQAEEKQFRPSGNRPENREIFRFPQLSSPFQENPQIFMERVKKF